MYSNQLTVDLLHRPSDTLGKTVRNTIAPGGPEGSEVKLFSAMLHREAVVIAQLRVPEGTNEITQVAALLRDVDLTGVVVTGDAAHAQHTTAAHLTQDRGGHYVLTVKGNQPTVLAQIVAALPPAVPGSADHVEEDRSKGKIVRRQIWTAPAGGVDFPGAAQVFRIRRDTFDHEGTRLSKEVVHGITSLTADQASPEQVAQFVRQHWGIGRVGPPHCCGGPPQNRASGFPRTTAQASSEDVAGCDTGFLRSRA